MRSAKTDYHVHPDYSIDAAPTKIRAYCQQAIQLGLLEICFTTHIESDPVRREIDNFVIVNGRKHPVHVLSWLDNYFNEIEKAQEEFKRNLKVKAGIEVGYIQGQEGEIEKIVKGYPFDFVLGAIHCLKHIAISSQNESPLYFCTRNINEVRADYFKALEEAVKAGLFDSIAHIDLYRRYGIKYCGSAINTIHQGAIEPILREMARRGMGLEINTSSQRRGLNEFHPAREIVKMAAETGISVYTIGSDAHTLQHLGDHIEDALKFLKEFNLCNYTFTRRQPIPCPL